MEGSWKRKLKSPHPPTCVSAAKLPRRKLTEKKETRSGTASEESSQWNCSLNQTWNTPSTQGQGSAAEFDCFLVQLSSMNQTAKNPKGKKIRPGKMNQRLKDSVLSGRNCLYPD